MRAILDSPRWRRRVIWAIPLAAVAVVSAALVVALPRGSGIPDAEPTPDQQQPPAQPDEAEAFGRAVPMTPATRREVNTVLSAFVRHAVVRDRPEAAWEFATPALRAGQTRADWQRGDVPVYPFPARVEEATGWSVLESFENDLLLTLLMHARLGTKRGAIAYQVELKRVGRGTDRRWLVDSFIPERVYTPAGAEKPEPGVTRQPSSVPSARLSPVWFVIPGLLLSLIVLVPATILVVNWRRGVRAEKAYRRSLAE